MSRKHDKKRHSQSQNTPHPAPLETAPTVVPDIAPESPGDAGSLRLGELHQFWGQNGTAIMVGAGVTLLTTTASNPIGRFVLVLVVLIGVYGMLAPYTVLPIPVPRSKTKHLWRAAFVAVTVGVVGGGFFSTPAGAGVRAWLGSLLPSPTVRSAPPLMTRWPPEIVYETVGGGKSRVVVAVGLANTTNAVLQVSIQSKAVVRTGTQSEDDQEAVLRGLSDELHLQTVVRAIVIRVPPHDTSMRFLIPGPEISQARWADIAAGREHVYFYALMKVKLGLPTTVRSKGVGAYPSATCGVATGSEVRECPADLVKP